MPRTSSGGTPVLAKSRLVLLDMASLQSEASCSTPPFSNTWSS